ncbi:hypothetical protein Tsubulata_031705, partial [Turnera subulata]
FQLKTCIRPQNHNLHFLLQIRLLSTRCTPENSSKESSFVVSYLTNTCGFGLKSALSASNYLLFKGPEKPDAVINFFKAYGLSHTQISRVVMRRPNVLVSKVKTISRKIEFLASKGASSKDVAFILANNPRLLGRSLEKQVIPVYNFVRNAVHSDEKAITVLRRGGDIFRNDINSHMAVSTHLLGENGVPESRIAWLLLNAPKVVLFLGRLKEALEEVKEMGFEPSKITFVLALKAVSYHSKSSWERKVDMYKSFGWSEEEFLVMFKRHPLCMTYSEAKLRGLLDFYVNKLGWGPSYIISYPHLLGMSFEKRIIVRDSVIQFLLSKGLIEKGAYSPRVFMLTEENFLNKYTRISPTISQTRHFLLQIRRRTTQCTPENSSKESSFVVSYLTNTCGFGLKYALSASNYLRFKGPEKPDAVINFFKAYGFSQTQISRVVKKDPKVLVYSVEIISRKIEFLASKGASFKDVALILANNHHLLGRSLEKQVIPVYNFVRNVVHSDEKAITVLRRGGDIFRNDINSHMAVSTHLLRENGVPESKIAWLLLNAPKVSYSNHSNILMFQFKLKTRISPTISQTRHFLLQIRRRTTQCTPENSSKESSFVVSYLTNTCGFGLKYALSASNYLRFKGPEKPDAVINFFKAYGFSQTQISRVVKKDPKVLVYSVEIISRKIEFLASKGASFKDVALILANNHHLLGRSLEKQVIPVYNFVRSVVHSDEKAITVLRRGGDIFRNDINSHMAVSTHLLRENGVPESKIAWLLLNAPKVMSFLGRFKETLEEVKEMGFDPSKITFVLAVKAVSSHTKSWWERKVDMYKSFGWSEEEFRGMFKKNPLCMTYSEAKLRGTLDFYLNKLGWGPSYIISYPHLLGLSLEKRIIVRDSVIQFLLSKGLIEKGAYLPTVFLLTEENFLNRPGGSAARGGQLHLRCYRRKQQNKEVGFCDLP